MSRMAVRVSIATVSPVISGSASVTLTRRNGRAAWRTSCHIDPASRTTASRVDTWIDLGATARRLVRDFLRWAHARGLSADLQVHWLGREGLPEDVLGEDERWTLLRRCLRDDSLALPLR